jgi:hypothetical protein
LPAISGEETEMHTRPDGPTALAPSHAGADQLSDEDARVHAWRFEQLRLAGYCGDDAGELADDRTISLDAARRLVLQRGCPPDLAARILR